MTRQEILKVARPILFNTEMVQAILDDRKATTRRPCKIKINGGNPVTHGLCDIAEYPETNIDGLCANFYDNEHFYKGCAKPPYKVGDYLYVRETFCTFDSDHIIDGVKYAYKADSTPESERARKEFGYKWRPSIHMPKEAARIFLRVTDVRVERLQDISTEDLVRDFGLDVSLEAWGEEECRRDAMFVWNSTVKKSELSIYGWDANPWVWVIEFERVEVE